MAAINGGFVAVVARLERPGAQAGGTVAKGAAQPPDLRHFPPRRAAIGPRDDVRTGRPGLSAVADFHPVG